jgi:hypothetical protein
LTRPSKHQAAFYPDVIHLGLDARVKRVRDSAEIWVPVFLIRAVRGAARGLKKRVVERWPFEVPNLQAAQDIVDETELGNDDVWEDADTVEIADVSGKILAARVYPGGDDKRGAWVKS